MVGKAYSKPQDILSLVPLPEISKLYATLQGKKYIHPWTAQRAIITSHSPMKPKRNQLLSSL